MTQPSFTPTNGEPQFAQLCQICIIKFIYSLFSFSFFAHRLIFTTDSQAGTTNPTVELFIVELDGSDNPERVKLETPVVSIVSADHILGSVFWINDEQLGAIWLNRRQDQAVLVSYDAATASSSHPMKIVSISLLLFHCVLRYLLFSILGQCYSQQHNRY